jgi:hypothetical protein
VTELHAAERLAGLARPRPRVVHSGLSRTAVAAGAWIALAGNTAAIVWLWLHGGGISDVHSVGDAFTSTGRLAGLLAAYMTAAIEQSLRRAHVHRRHIHVERFAL